MTQKVPKATHYGELHIGDITIPCAVLEDGTRVITQRGVYGAIGRSGATGGLGKKEDAQQMPRFLAPNNLKPFVSEELERALTPLVFKGKGRINYGFKAEILPEICNVYLDARTAGILKPSQQKFAVRCELLVRGFSRIGIIALVDEATGYQYERERDELNRLLAVYLSEERLKWAKMFPDEFYKQIYRLRNWPYPTGVKRTPLIGKITNSIVYERLPAGVLDELRKRNPVVQQNKRRKWKHTQFLSEDIGQPDLRDHLLQLIALMRASSNWSNFKRLFSRAFPVGPEQAEMEFMGGDE